MMAHLLCTFSRFQAVHHRTVAAAAGHDYAPPPETLAVLQQMWRRQRHDVTTWAGTLRASGRNT